MTPRKDSDFYKLKTVHEKICYLNGMPKPFLNRVDFSPEFTGFKCNSRSITPAAQTKAFTALKDNWGASHSAFFLAHPHDREALGAACGMLKALAKSGFKSFEFVSPFEDLRFIKAEDNDIKDLYIILGANHQDKEMTNRIRRWVRQPHGASIWVVGAVDNPYRWASEDLGYVPDFMFWFKRAGASVG